MPSFRPWPGGEGHALLYPANSVLLVGIGATLGKVGMATTQCSSNQQVNAITLEPGNNPLFLTYFLHAFRAEVRIAASGNTLPILNQDKTKSLRVLRPPPDEQEKIAHWLTENDRRAGRVVGDIERGISLLSEYRSALITAAVTGQIEGLR